MSSVAIIVSSFVETFNCDRDIETMWIFEIQKTHESGNCSIDLKFGKFETLISICELALCIFAKIAKSFHCKTRVFIFD